MARLNKKAASSDAPAKPRRPHRKSRNGCDVCKKRHMKCDESRPVCVNCKISDRGSQCVYINIGARSPPDTSSSSGTPVPTNSSSSLPPPIPTSLPADGSVGLTSDPFSDTLGRGDSFDLNHFALYRHLLVNRFIIASTGLAEENILDFALDYALQAPYLMNQLLAVAALHLSKPPTAQQPYHQLATSLQTRALALFNQVRQEVSEETCIPMFLFSSLVGLHVLCDILQGPRESLSTVLDRFITYLSIHRGVRAVTNQSWKTIKQTRLGPLLQRTEDALRTAETNAKPTKTLIRMIESNASLSSASKYREAIFTLQRSFSLHTAQKESGKRQLDSVMVFCLDVNDGYIHLLNKRQPEALVIFAYFAVLLHWNRTEWTIGDGGQYLIRAVTHHLGSHWAEWLHWPNSVLEDTSS